MTTTEATTARPGRLKRALRMAALAALLSAGACVSFGPPPPEGAQAKLRIAGGEAMWYNVISMGSEQCAYPRRNILYRNVFAHSADSSNIPAGQRVYLSVSLFVGGGDCSQMLSFVPEPDHHYRLDVRSDYRSCYTRIVDEEAGANAETFEGHNPSLGCAF